MGRKELFMSSQFSPSSVKRLLLVAVAGTGALAFLPHAGAADQGGAAATQPSEPNVNEAMLPLHLPDGFVAKDEDAASGVKTTLVQLTNRAVTKDSYDSFFSSFLADLARRDKERAHEFKGVDQAHLNDLIGMIQTGWHNKYGQDFDVSDKNLVFNDDFPIVQGEVSDPTAAANAWPVPASEALAVAAGSTSDQQQSNTKELTAGRAVAIIRFPAGDGIPEMDVSLIHQALTGWYVDIPVDRTGEEIYNNLANHLNYVATHQELWPSDVNNGYRMVARNVAAALYGVSWPGGTASAQ
jgi:hypothetical protein